MPLTIQWGIKVEASWFFDVGKYNGVVLFLQAHARSRGGNFMETTGWAIALAAGLAKK